MVTASRRRVALITMPLHSVAYPSIQIGTLKSVLHQQGWDACDFYFNYSFSRLIGHELHETLSQYCDILLGDWLFAKSAFGMDDSSYFENIRARVAERLVNAAEIDAFVAKLLEIRDERVGRWLNDLVASEVWDQFGVIGFSCTFSQTVASLALAKKLRAAYPHCILVMGGSSLEGEMGHELAAKAPEIDAVVSGEGEVALVELLRLVEAGRKIPRLLSATRATAMAELPTPDYDTYYRTLENDERAAILTEKGFGSLLVETSRGCWWGEKSHCTFCGLNGETMKYREKSAEQVLGEINHLSRRHLRYDFRAVDNILSQNYFSSLLPKLQENKTSYQFFFEVKSDLTFDRIKALSDAGIRAVQPGIESLNTAVLKLMKKGITATQNIEMLKWSAFFKLDVTWNLLFGFPGEQTQSYLEMLELIPALVHLTPPDCVGAVRVDRFSPYFKQYRDRLRPSRLYWACYPADWDFQKLAYYFVGELPSEVDSNVVAQLAGAVGEWKKIRAGNTVPELRFKQGLGFGHIVDTRFGRKETSEVDQDYFKVAKLLNDKSGTSQDVAFALQISQTAADQILSEFEKAKFVIRPDNRWIWLPVPEKHGQVNAA